MARLLRIEYAGACYHVINRGNYRRSLFDENGASEAFERTLGEAAVKFSWKVHAYVIMRNHFHLALELSEPNLSNGMKWLQGTWTRRYNGFRKVVGRPFQGRFKALLVEPSHALARVCHYIHLNPCRAKIVTSEQLEEYRWSSLPKFFERKRPAWLESSTVLSDAGALTDNAAGWRSYLSYLKFLSEDESAKEELNSTRLSRGWCVGSDEFRDGIKRQFEERGSLLELSRFAGLEPEELQRERHLHWEERLQDVARLAKVNLIALPTKKSADEKVLLAAALKQSTSVSNGWLARRLEMGKPASVSQFVRRWMLSPSRKSQIEAMLSKVKM